MVQATTVNISEKTKVARCVKRDKMSKCQNVILAKCQYCQNFNVNVEMSKFQDVKMSKLKHVNVKTSKCQNVKFKKCQNVQISKFQDFKI